MNSEFMFPEYPTLRELRSMEMDLSMALLNHFMETDIDKLDFSGFDVYMTTNSYKRMLLEYMSKNNRHEQPHMIAL